MKTIRAIIGGVIGGVVITLASAVYNSTPSGLVGAVWYGFPLNWINKLITYPTAWSVQWIGLIVDLVVWFIVVFIVLMLIGMTMKKR